MSKRFKKVRRSSLGVKGHHKSIKKPKYEDHDLSKIDLSKVGDYLNEGKICWERISEDELYVSYEHYYMTIKSRTPKETSINILKINAEYVKKKGSDSTYDRLVTIGSVYYEKDVKWERIDKNELCASHGMYYVIRYSDTTRETTLNVRNISSSYIKKNGINSTYDCLSVVGGTCQKDGVTWERTDEYTLYASYDIYYMVLYSTSARETMKLINRIDSKCLRENGSNTVCETLAKVGGVYDRNGITWERTSETSICASCGTYYGVFYPMIVKDIARLIIIVNLDYLRDNGSDHTYDNLTIDGTVHHEENIKWERIGDSLRASCDTHYILFDWTGTNETTRLIRTVDHRYVTTCGTTI